MLPAALPTISGGGVAGVAQGEGAYRPGRPSPAPGPRPVDGPRRRFSVLPFTGHCHTPGAGRAGRY